MGFFPMVESFFFMSLGISFFLIFLMVYHFKNRVDTLEKNYESLADICTTMVTELDVLIKRSIKPSYETNHNILSSLFATMPNTVEDKVPFIIKEGPAPFFDFEDENEEPEIIVEDNIIVEEVKDNLQSTELQSIFDDTVSELEPTDTEAKRKSKTYKKMNLAMLRTIAVNKGFSGSEQELWKLKKADILSWIENKEKELISLE